MSPQEAALSPASRTAGGLERELAIPLVVERAPGMPRNEDGPVFAAPWEARAFAIVVQLHRASCYSWQEWVSCLSGEIAKTAAAGDEGRPYYEHWLAACERLLRDKGLVDAQALVAKMADIEQRIAGNDDHHDHQHGHDHGHGNRGN